MVFAKALEGQDISAILGSLGSAPAPAVAAEAAPAETKKAEGAKKGGDKKGSEYINKDE